MPANILKALRTQREQPIQFYSVIDSIQSVTQTHTHEIRNLIACRLFMSTRIRFV